MTDSPAAAPPAGPGDGLGLIGVAFGRGAREQGCADGPEALRRAGLVEELRRRGVAAAWRATLTEEPRAAEPAEAVARICRPLAAMTEDMARQGAPAAVIGGDHSIAIGTWSGVARALRARGPLGLVWIDAHLDSHVPATTPSGAIHGMPLAALLGFGDPRLTRIAGRQPAVLPWHACIVGARSWEPEERALLARLGVRIFFMAEVRRRGLPAVLEEALAIAATGTAGVGLSIDCDAVDPSDAPGVGSPVAGGLRAPALTGALSALCRRTRFATVEIAEFNPHLDRAGATARLVRDLLAATAGREG